MPGKSTIALIVVAVVAAFGVWLFLAGPKPVTDGSHSAVTAPVANDAPLAVESAPEPVAATAAATGDAPADVAPPEMMEAKSELEAQYAERRKDLPEEVLKPIDDDIGMIEGIAADLMAALASEPENDDLKRMLVQTYRNEMKLLKKALHLSSDESVENAEEEPAPTN